MTTTTHTLRVPHPAMSSADAAARGQRIADQFGARVAMRLNESAQATPHDISERLRVARQQALAKRKKQAASVFEASAATSVQLNGVAGSAASLSLGGGSDSDGPTWFTRIASLLPLGALVAGLLVISAVSNDDRARELAEVDAALLTDDLPPAAFVDPGFAQFVKQQQAGDR